MWSLAQDEVLVVVGARGATTAQEREDEQRSLLEEKRLLCALPPSIDLLSLCLCSALHPATGPLTAWLGVSRLQNEEALLGDLGSVVRGVNADGGVGGEDMGGGGSFTQRMTATIMANLVVQINNVRVVYEDASSITARPFAFGLARKGRVALDQLHVG